MVGGQPRITLIAPQAGGRSPEREAVKLFWDLATLVCLCFPFPISLVSVSN